MKELSQTTKTVTLISIIAVLTTISGFQWYKISMIDQKNLNQNCSGSCVPTTSIPTTGQPSTTSLNSEVQLTVQIGNLKTTLPKGWYISSTQTKIRNLTAQEKTSLISGKPADHNDLIIPINKTTTVQISNGISTLTFDQPNNIMYGAVGFIAEEISSSSKVIVAPNGSLDGFVTEKMGNIYAFKDIFNCNGNAAQGDPCIKYGYVLGVYPLNTTYSGTDNDLTVMQDFYKNEILNKSLNLYNETPFNF